VDRISRSERWFEVYSDPLAVVFLRSEPELVRLAQDLVHPVSQWTFFEEAQLRLREGRESEALDSVSKALVLDPRWPQALVFRGTLHLRAGRHAEGERDLREALAWDSRVPDAHFNLAVLAWTRGERKLALKELRRELELNSGHTPARALLKEIQGR
jgi:Flp pilus assembly protein TadD